MLIKEINGEFCATEILKLFSGLPYPFALESSLVDPERGRFSIIGFDPFGVHRQKANGSLDQLKQKFSRYKYENNHLALPFYAGIVGYLAYDHGLYQEKIKQRSIDDLKLPDCLFGFYDSAIVLDHLEKKLFITSSGLPVRDGALCRQRAQKRMDMILGRLKLLEPLRYDLSPSSEKTGGALLSNFSGLQYRQAVKKALEYINDGDIYQVNLSHRFCFYNEKATDAVLLYKLLGLRSPSSFSAYFDAGLFKIISSSPERFLHVKGDIVHTCPMKGTRPRGHTPQDDLRFRRQILESEKEKAELLMIIDLERNDLGRVCRYGSVNVRDMRSIETYSTVFQATSTVEGKLCDGKDAFDLIAAAFPGGSITGCPKIRSMQIIEELEPTRRGIYTGSLGYIDFCGNMDLNILIRTLLVNDDTIYFQVGSGIVADSTPEEEYEETLVKARAMKEALLDIVAGSTHRSWPPEGAMASHSF